MQFHVRFGTKVWNPTDTTICHILHADNMMIIRIYILLIIATGLFINLSYILDLLRKWLNVVWGRLEDQDHMEWLIFLTKIIRSGFHTTGGDTGISNGWIFIRIRRFEEKYHLYDAVYQQWLKIYYPTEM